MRIDTYIDRNEIMHVSIRGEVTTENHKKMVLKAFEKENVTGITITFFHANVLSSDIIEKLYGLNKSTTCKIYVFQRYLYSYLINLGIRCEYMRNKSLEEVFNRYMNINEVSDDEDISLEEVNNFLEGIFSTYGYDYREYQKDSIIRRINICMLKEGIKTFREFQQLVLEDFDTFQQLFLDLSINTTEFFRDPEVFYLLREKILPYLNSYTHIKIWCVGCSTGKEPYSLAILLEELGLLDKTQIYATDINPYVIEEAKNGLFSTKDIHRDDENYKKAGGEREFKEYFYMKEHFGKVKKHLKKNILFFQHSLIGSGSLNEFELILCRNVLIYFNQSLQNKVLKNFYNSLHRNGFLILGKSEGLMLNGGAEFFTKYRDKERVYKVRNI